MSVRKRRSVVCVEETAVCCVGVEETAVCCVSVEETAVRVSFEKTVVCVSVVIKTEERLNADTERKRGKCRCFVSVGRCERNKGRLGRRPSGNSRRLIGRDPLGYHKRGRGSAKCSGMQ